MANAPQPGEIIYSKLTPASIEVLAEVGLRLTAGWTTREIAEHFNQAPPRFRHVAMPKNFTMTWVSARVRELKEDMRSTIES